MACPHRSDAARKSRPEIGAAFVALKKNQAAPVPRETGTASHSDSASSWNPSSDLNPSRTR